MGAEHYHEAGKVVAALEAEGLGGVGLVFDGPPKNPLAKPRVPIYVAVPVPEPEGEV